jgi:pilus assembly protein Flp/PilA
LSAVEYGLLVTLIALALIVGAGALGGSLNTFFQDLADYFAGTGG